MESGIEIMVGGRVIGHVIKHDVVVKEIQDDLLFLDGMHGQDKDINNSILEMNINMNREILRNRFGHEL